MLHVFLQEAHRLPASSGTSGAVQQLKAPCFYTPTFVGRHYYDQETTKLQDMEQPLIRTTSNCHGRLKSFQNSTERAKASPPHKTENLPRNKNKVHLSPLYALNVLTTWIFKTRLKTMLQRKRYALNIVSHVWTVALGPHPLQTPQGNMPNQS